MDVEIFKCKRKLYSFLWEVFLIGDGSVADPDPGSGAFLTPESGIRNRFFPDSGSRIPDPKPIYLRAY
jgi:hypothetical protein